MMNHTRVQVKKDLGLFKIDQIVKVKIDEFGTPLERFWRNRFKDMSIDNCITILEDKEIVNAKKIGKKINEELIK